MSFNAPGFSGRAFERLVTEARPHVFALQEVTVQATPPSGQVQGGGLVVVPALLGRGYGLSRLAGDAYAPVREPIFSLLEPAGPAQLVAGYPQEGLWRSGGITRSLYHWQGRVIAVYSVHMHSFSGERPWKRVGGERHVFSLSAWYRALRSYRADFRIRAEQAREFRRVLESEPHPFIVCGDLNSTPYHWAYAHLAAPLQDAFKGAGSGWGGTYHARLPLVRIDYVLASKEWEVRAARVDKNVASDHRPLVAELALRPQE
ncbi:MAG: endonuclease/exonuclease/phosphatase family protein [Rhodothermales bacterium]